MMRQKGQYDKKEGIKKEKGRKLKDPVEKTNGGRE